MYIYNSASRKREEFIPNDPNLVKMYTCGPTVYHFAHIGNLRSYIMEDILEKYLRFAGYNVKRVMNITDVGHLSSDADEGEDKMLKGAKRENKSVMEIAKFYTDAFFADCAKLNIKTPDVVEPATNCIDEYINIISTLLEKEYAYVAGGNVYFDSSKLDKYYVFNDFNEEDLAVGVREGVEEDSNKRNKNDFVLWFTKSKFEDQALKWDSPWGVGYPGWHIECSGISMKHLGEELDIHCGGIDNAFPHHTNEIAQSEAFLGHKWCKYWMHVLHLNTNSGKMSKSKGEFLTVSLLEEKGYDPLAYRFFCLQSHYRKSLVFSWENLDNAQTSYNKLISRIAALKPGEGTIDVEAYSQLKEKFSAAMDNDLNSSLAVTALYDVLKAKTNDATKLALIASFDTVLSLDLLAKADAKREAMKKEAAATAASFSIISESGEENAEITAKIQARQDAKKAKNFAEADRIRDELKAEGIEITDIPNGAKWKRV
ncbi:MAG: cysteine--tRNA ligase [Oscillospiraceae bacterium]|nr:cysteine--tRNA ligase [Oscillospiraceae bacterium]